MVFPPSQPWPTRILAHTSEERQVRGANASDLEEGNERWASLWCYGRGGSATDVRMTGSGNRPCAHASKDRGRATRAASLGRRQRGPTTTHLLSLICLENAVRLLCPLHVRVTCLHLSLAGSAACALAHQ